MRHQSQFARLQIEVEDWTTIATRLCLSGKEAEIVKGVLQDLKDEEIADALGMSVHTLRTHVGRLHTKLGVEDRVQLVSVVFATYLEVLGEAPTQAPLPVGPSE